MHDWKGATVALLDEMVALRRAIHAEPELGLRTPSTTTKARVALEGLPLEFADGGSTTGFVATLRGPTGGRTVLLRADMDALPLDEETGLPFTSQIPGAMHACGHDAHVAMLVGAAKALCEKRDTLSGTVQFMFQPGEEGWHGARHMLDDGLVKPLPDAAFAIHITPNIPSGTMTGRPGPMLAAADRFEIIVEGKGGHASQPHDAVDPIPVAGDLASAIHTMVTRRIPAFDPCVITTGRIIAGTACNVIPGTAVIEGTIRSFSAATRELACEGLRRLAEHIPAAHLCRGKITIDPVFPVTVCDHSIAAIAKHAALEIVESGEWIDMPFPAMGAEDFAYVLQKVPGAMIFLGATPEGGDWRDCCALHSNRMVLDEKVMALGAAMHCAFVEAYFNKSLAS